MRSLVPVLSCAVVLLTATAVASSPHGNSASISPVLPKTMTCDPVLTEGSTHKKGSESEVPWKVCKQLRKETEQATEQRKNMTAESRGCFKLKVYGPVSKPHTSELTGLDRPYSPRPFVLQSTCSSGGKVME